MENVFIGILRQARIDFILNDAENRVPGNINISISSASGETLLHRLDLKGISISTGSACDSVNTHLFQVIREINAPPEFAEGTIRMTFGRANHPEDASEVAASITNVVQRKIVLYLTAYAGYIRGGKEWQKADVQLR
jgi:cysteine desulfurase